MCVRALTAAGPLRGQKWSSLLIGLGVGLESKSTLGSQMTEEIVQSESSTPLLSASRPMLLCLSTKETDHGGGSLS